MSSNYKYIEPTICIPKALMYKGIHVVGNPEGGKSTKLIVQILKKEQKANESVKITETGNIS